MTTSPNEHSGESPTAVSYADGELRLLVRSAVLRAVTGPDEGRQCAIEREPITVGCAAENDLVLSDPLVSRQHLQVSVSDNGYLFRDLDSTNGTTYRGARINDAVLRPGAELRLGSTVLRIERGSERSETISPQNAFGQLVGNSRSMQAIFGLLAAVAPTESTVLICGETGTGKELVAEEIHRQSSRAKRPFVIFDCSAVAAELIESELFGHKKGAFTGATTDRRGVFEQAHRGTLFLDEIGELPLALQTRLLRVLDRRTVRPVGDDHVRHVDVRVIAATNRDLPQRVAQREFRQDLFYRLSVVEVRLPPLRERREDIAVLVRHFLRSRGFANVDEAFPPEVLEVFSNRKWNGNVRELRNVVERALLLADGAQALVEERSVSPSVDLPPEAPTTIDRKRPPAAAREPATSEPQPRPRGRLAGRRQRNWLRDALPEGFLHLRLKQAREELLSQFEQLYLDHLVDQHGINISRIAATAGVDRQLVRRLLRKHCFTER